MTPHVAATGAADSFSPLIKVRYSPQPAVRSLRTGLASRRRVDNRTSTTAPGPGHASVPSGRGTYRSGTRPAPTGAATVSMGVNVYGAVRLAAAWGALADQEASGAAPVAVALAVAVIVSSAWWAGLLINAEPRAPASPKLHHNGHSEHSAEP
jgi:hypothetical protein